MTLEEKYFWGDLKKLYEEEKLSSYKIAKIKGCAKSVVLYHLKKQNITLRKGKDMFSEETIRFLKESNTGNKNHFYGKIHSEDTRKTISLKNSGRKLTDANKKNISLGLMGHFGWSRKYFTKEQSKIGQKNKKRIWIENNLEKVKEQKRIWAKKNPNSNKEYREKNLEKVRIRELKKSKRNRLIENERRKQLGLPLVGESFLKEMELLLYVHNLFKDYEILSHHRTWNNWGVRGRLELDIYIPKLKLAFEYMGTQHYKFNNFFHKTEEEFNYQRYKDRCKNKLCKLKGITLIKIRYDEKLSEQLVLSKLKYLPIEIKNDIII